MNRISDLIKMLESLKEEHGDIPVSANRTRDADGEEEVELITEDIVTVQDAWTMFSDEPEELEEETQVCHVGDF